MATVPYQANILSGAQAYSPDGARLWGVVSDTLRFNVRVIAFVGDKVRIGYPLWNGREWCVRLADTVVITPPPPPVAGAPDPIPAGEFEIVLDGASYVNTNPIEWIRKPLEGTG